MGYLTQHTLSVDDNKKHEHSEAIGMLSGYAQFTFAEPIKWYEMERDMRSYSRAYPLVLFAISGIGEEYGDIWTHYFRNGKSVNYNAVITHPEFNEADLK